MVHAPRREGCSSCDIAMPVSWRHHPRCLLPHALTGQALVCVLTAATCMQHLPLQAHVYTCSMYRRQPASMAARCCTMLRPTMRKTQRYSCLQGIVETTDVNRPIRWLLIWAYASQRSCASDAGMRGLDKGAPPVIIGRGSHVAGWQRPNSGGHDAVVVTTAVRCSGLVQSPGCGAMLPTVLLPCCMAASPSSCKRKYAGQYQAVLLHCMLAAAPAADQPLMERPWNRKFDSLALAFVASLNCSAFASTGPFSTC